MSYRSYRYPQFESKSRPRGDSSWIVLVLVGIISGFVVGIWVIKINLPTNQIIYSPVEIAGKVTASDFVEPSPTPTEMPVTNNPQIASIVENRLKDQPGDYAIVIESLDGDLSQRYSYHADRLFPSASLYKLFLLATAYEAIGEGDLKMGQTIAASTDHLNEVLGGVEFGYEDLEGKTISYDVKYILGRIAGVSDNYAAVMLAEKLSWDRVREQTVKIGANRTIIREPISTTANDIALFWRKLYFGQIYSRQASDELIELLSTARINNRIPAQLPAGLKIAHKTGELARIRHDSGIVFIENKPYLIVLMSKELEGEDDGIELLANISKDIYDYFSQL